MAAPAVLTAAATKAIQLARDPEVQAKALEYYRKATGSTSVPSVAQLSEVVKRGPAPAATALRGFVRAGLNPDDIFNGIILAEQADATTRRLIEELRGLYKSIAGKLDSTALLRANGDGNFASSLFAKEVTNWAIQHFGSAKAAREAHAKLRAFINMDTQLVEQSIILFAR